jgi:hypothetical protein
MRNWPVVALGVVVFVALVGGLALAASCNTNTPKATTMDIVTGIPWTAPETNVYDLSQNNGIIGTTTLGIQRKDANFVLTQSTKDPNGNSDVSVINADASTLKPVSATRAITDSSQKTLLEVTYSGVGTDQCSSGKIAHITQSVFSPPTDAKPDSKRTVPKCLPDHSYDIDESLFIWRTIDFTKGAQVTYNNLATNSGDNHLVTLTVMDQEKVTVPAGTFNAWLVEVASERSRQKVWFATTPDHRMLQYVNNQGQSFQLKNSSR